MSSATETAVSAVQSGHPSFDYTPRTRVVFGAGAFAKLGDLASNFVDPDSGRNGVLLVTDPGLTAAGHSATAVASLEAAGLSVAVFDNVSPNPTTDDVDRCVAFAAERNVSLIVGLGGGSSMDCGKGANFLLSNGGRMQDYHGVGKATKTMLPMIAVPTTSGTGSEAQSFAVIADAATHMKMPCGDHKAACKVAILDPELTITMPRSVASATGIDAMTHAIESYVTSKRNPVSQMFSRQAWQLLSNSYSQVMNSPSDIEARGNMLLGAHLAGAAIENSMLGSAHATANPLSAHFNTVHGVAVGIMLPHIIRWNAPEVGALYHDLAIAAGWAGPGDTPSDAAESLASGIQDLLRVTDMPTKLSDAIEQEISNDMLTTLATEASRQWTANFNPRPMTIDAFQQVYRNAM